MSARRPMTAHFNVLVRPRSAASSSTTTTTTHSIISGSTGGRSLSPPRGSVRPPSPPRGRDAALAEEVAGLRARVAHLEELVTILMRERDTPSIHAGGSPGLQSRQTPPPPPARGISPAPGTGPSSPSSATQPVAVHRAVLFSCGVGDASIRSALDTLPLLGFQPEERENTLITSDVAGMAATRSNLLRALRWGGREVNGAGLALLVHVAGRTAAAASIAHPEDELDSGSVGWPDLGRSLRELAVGAGVVVVLDANSDHEAASLPFRIDVPSGKILCCAAGEPSLPCHAIIFGRNLGIMARKSGLYASAEATFSRLLYESLARNPTWSELIGDLQHREQGSGGSPDAAIPWVSLTFMPSLHEKVLSFPTGLH